ncbi:MULTISPECIES: sulfur carrier protein ThiS [Campylobacter]|uniref:sulfur carrier protein ThiS n=1 Tax=Campylobacter TaxID=194 RepID=UPI0014735DDF|nr:MULTISPECIES: sulfur carrier protein ThiS [unclassified Campylobacter]MBE3609238.1 sulfur carrier protein ThiS [Campylobacter sp. RM12916]
MVNIVLNGKEITLESDMTVEEFLLKFGFELKFIALERDYEILPRNMWQEQTMSLGKKYEVVEFVGGG